ncbi:MAG: ArnT family glycosyltransferase [Acidobacteriota bacterium]
MERSPHPGVSPWPGATRIAAGAVLLVAVLVLGFALRFRNTVPFGPGPDPFDYITTAGHLLDTGTLRFDIQTPDTLHVDPRYGVLFVPEPFVVSEDGRHYASLYPPGTSCLMALAMVLAGRQTGPFLVSPVLGAGCVLLLFVLARTWFRPAPSAVAAFLLASSPIFLAPARAPLSDAPALFFILVGLIFLVRRGPWAPVAAGLGLGMAVLIRLPSVGVLPAAVLWLATGNASRRDRLRSLLALGAGLAPPLAALAAVNTFLYGSPLASGYALKLDLVRPFALEYFPVSFPRMVVGLVMGAGPVALAAALIGLARLRDRRALAAAVWIAGVVGFFSFYGITGNIRLQRFLLPALPVVIMLALAGVAPKGAAQLRHQAALALLVMAALADLYVLAPGYHLTRPYSDDPRAPQPDLAGLVARLDPDGVIVSRVYGGRLREEQDRITVNWSRSGAAGTRRLIHDLLAQGRPVYLLESAAFEERGRWWVGLNVLPIPIPTRGVYLYRVKEPLPGARIPLRKFLPAGGGGA